MMQVTTLIFVLSAVTGSALGQLLLKTGATRVSGLDRFEFLLSAGRDIYVLSGLLAWTASTICWLYVLRVTPLSKAYGLNSLTYVLVFLASVFILGEEVRRLQSIGTVLIAIGVACLLSGK